MTVAHLNANRMELSKRDFLKLISTLAAGNAAGCSVVPAAKSGAPSFFKTRGVVLIPDDLTLVDWPERAHRAGLTTIGLHHSASPKVVIDFVRSERGQTFLEQCRALGLQVEYELHAMRELLPRSLFAANPEFFRMNEKGERTPDANFCVHSGRALEIVAENALAMAELLRPTTGRYFYWGDDAKAWCQCPKCRGLSESDQALVLENYLLAKLRRIDDRAQLAHLAYSNTLQPPKQLWPAPGIFLEYAPINRRYDMPYHLQTGPSVKDALDLLDANLEIFDRSSAQVLEYWLDVSRFSKWRKPAVRLPWNADVFEADLGTYGKRGLRHVTSFAVFIDADYVSRHGEPVELIPYGRGLSNWRLK